MTCSETCSTRFFICRKCGNIVGIICDSGVPLVCCGEEMSELIPGTVDASREKHVPVVSKKCGKITVDIGAEPHPMLPEHYIQWVYLQTERGGQRKCLKPGEKPQAVFTVTDDMPLAVYEYCNIHGLWKADI
jgi:superoxide reductase